MKLTTVRTNFGLAIFLFAGCVGSGTVENGVATAGISICHGGRTHEESEVPGITIRKAFGVDDSLVKSELAKLKQEDTWRLFDECVVIPLDKNVGPFNAVEFKVKRDYDYAKEGTNRVRKVKDVFNGVSLRKDFDSTASYEDYCKAFSDAADAVGDMLGIECPVPTGDFLECDPTKATVQSFWRSSSRTMSIFGSSEGLRLKVPELSSSVNLANGQCVVVSGMEPVYVKRKGVARGFRSASLILEIKLQDRHFSSFPDERKPEVSVSEIDVGVDLSQAFVAALRKKVDEWNRWNNDGKKRLVSRFEKTQKAKGQSEEKNKK